MTLSVLTLSLVAATSMPAEAVDTSHLTLADPDPVCEYNERMALDDRASPLESFRVTLGEGDVVLCWGAPAARGRTMIGGDAIPFGEIWRMGANEPTVLHTEVPLSVGGVAVEPGSWSIYAVPGPETWTLHISASTSHWGNQIDAGVRSAEIGTLEVEAGEPAEHVESLTFRVEDPGTRSASLVMEWEMTRLEIPVTATGGTD